MIWTMIGFLCAFAAGVITGWWFRGTVDESADESRAFHDRHQFDGLYTDSY